MKDLFNKIARAASVYLDPYGENELKRMELADKKFENIKNNNSFDFSDLPNKKHLQNLHHEIDHAAHHQKIEEINTPRKRFNRPKPPLNIGIIPAVTPAPVAQVQEQTPAQRANQVATVMAGGIQSELKAPRTARFRKQAGRNV